MSALAGVCYWDGRPVPDSVLAAFVTPSTEGELHRGGIASPMTGVALHARVLAFDALSTTEQQPFSFSSGSLLTWDGRLDNRDDLLLTLWRDIHSTPTDAALVAAAFSRWGTDALPRLIGDWSLAIWDAVDQRIIVARDYMGNRPLYYLQLPSCLAWASSLDALATGFDLYSRPNEAYIAGVLTSGVPPDITPFEHVLALRAGHVLSASRETPLVAPRRFWTFQPASIRYRDRRTYTDQLRFLLTEAVRVRLRSNRQVWAHLSGGFDSSTNVCLAHRLISIGLVEAPAIQPASTVSSSSPESDESSFIAAVERWCGLTTVRKEWVPRIPTFHQLLGNSRPFAGPSSSSSHSGPDNDYRIVLSGQLGDLVMLRGSLHRISMLEALYDGQPLTFLLMTLRRSRRRQLPWLASLVRFLWTSHLSPAIRQRRAARSRFLALARAAKVSPREPALVFGITRNLFAKVPRIDSTAYPSVDALPRPKRPMAASLYRIADHGVLSNPDGRSRRWRTFPYSHRPLVEYMLATPQLAFWDPVLNRAGMRHAFADVLPPELLARRTKGDPTTASRRAADAWAFRDKRLWLPDEQAGNWQLVRRGYVESLALHSALEQFLDGSGAPSRFLNQCIHLEAWLQTLTNSRPGKPCSDERGAHMSQLPMPIQPTCRHTLPMESSPFTSACSE